MIPETFSYIESKMPNYICLAAKQHNYFVATLLRKGRVYLDHHTVKDFHTSRYLGIEARSSSEILILFFFSAWAGTCWRRRLTAGE